MNNLKDIHNLLNVLHLLLLVVLSGFQWTIWRIYTTHSHTMLPQFVLFYQDFNEQFEGYTQRTLCIVATSGGCFIRISMNNLKDIHNYFLTAEYGSKVVLSGFQWTIWRIYTTMPWLANWVCLLFYQDFNEQFEGYTQRLVAAIMFKRSCFIRISMNNLKDIHNL